MPAVGEIDGEAHLARAAAPQPIEADEAPLDRAVPADQVDGLGQLLQMLGARTFQHVGADLVRHLHEILAERAAQALRQRLARAVRLAELEQRVGEGPPRHHLADDEPLLGVVLDQIFEALHRWRPALDLLQLRHRLDELGALEGAVALRQQFFRLAQRTIRLVMTAEPGISACLFELREKTQTGLALRQLGLERAGMLQRLVMPRHAVQGLAEIDAHALRLARRELERIAQLHEMAEQHDDIGVALRLELDAAKLGDDLGDLRRVAFERGKGERRQELGRRALVVTAPRIDHRRLAPDLGEFVIVRRRRGFGQGLCLAQLAQRVAVELEAVVHDAEQAVHARPERRVSLQAEQQRRELRQEDIGIGAAQIDDLLDGVKRCVCVLRFGGHDAPITLRHAAGGKPRPRRTSIKFNVQRCWPKLKCRQISARPRLTILEQQEYIRGEV